MQKNKNYDLKRFILAQERDYEVALAEIKNGRKRSHWMWYIFPQIKGLGRSSTSEFYGIANLDEATAYLSDSLLSDRLVEISSALLGLETDNALEIFGNPDYLKLKSSMTLFSCVEQSNPLFLAVLEKYFKGKCERKLEFILF